MPIDLHSIFPGAKPDAAAADHADPEGAWQESMVTMAATALGVLIVAVVAVLMGMS
jgi:hypothetical protein